MDNFNNFLEKINFGYDGLIRSIEIFSFKNATITVSTMDVENNYEWINVKFRLEEIDEFRVNQTSKTTNVVLTYGIRIKKIQEELFIDFSPYIDIVESIEDFRKSDVYFSCKDIKWEFLNYSEV